MLGDRTESAAAETAALDGHRKTDHLVGGNLCLAVGRMRHPRIGQLIQRIHFLHGQRNRRRINPDFTRIFTFAVTLDQRARIAGIRFDMQDARSMGVENRILRHRLVRRHADHTARTVCVFDFADEAHDLCALWHFRCGSFGCHTFHRVRIDRRIQRPRHINAR